MKFLTRSLLILLALYGVLFALGDALLVHYGGPLWAALAFPLVFAAFQYICGPYIIDWVLDIVWDDAKTDLPARNREFLEQLCAQRGLRVPRVGIIYSGTPNAFSFGRLRGDARIVVTKGLLDVLTPEEANAVIAHELGHIEHYDFAVMAIASLVPLLLYQIYVITRHINKARLVAYTAYLCYLLTQFVVLFLNRIREYYADHYSAEVTHDPALLSSALVKIAYGLVRAEGEYEKAVKEGSKDEKAYWRREHRLGGSVAVLGISNVRSGAALALAGANPETAAAVMQWDLVNPWARVYELQSTHPLTALRVRLLNDDAALLGRTSEYPLSSDQKIRWGGSFALELFLWASPWLCGVALFTFFAFDRELAQFGVVPPAILNPILLIVLGVTWFLRIMYRYRGAFRDTNVETLIRDLGVSQMQPRAVRLKGEIVGRGMPGAFWSPDLVLRDLTGIIFLLYRQSIPLARFFFAISEAENYIGQEVTVEGWFRRGATPYVEMAKLIGPDGTPHRTWSRWIQLALALGAVVLGFYWLLT
jgi:heat shock protein HtpX